MKTCEKINLTAQYSGKTSHAAAAPDLGRSAFDALLMAISGAEKLEKHKPSGLKLAYVILSSGNVPCNVIPDYAEGQFTLSADTEEKVAWGRKRLRDILEGAAQMTGTSCVVKEN